MSPATRNPPAKAKQATDSDSGSDATPAATPDTTPDPATPAASTTKVAAQTARKSPLRRKKKGKARLLTRTKQHRLRAKVGSSASENENENENDCESDTDTDDDGEFYQVEQILDHEDRRKHGGRKRFYLLKWRDYGHKFNTWEPEKNLNCHKLQKAYDEANPRPAFT